MYKNVIKRLIDIIISLMLIPFILILIIPVALFIKLEDHGDVFYNAERYGCNMKKFKMFKFRSMKMNAPDVRNADGTTFNSEKDVRLTKIGGFLRKTSIDELPQIFNVLLGDMSFVGPRPSPMGNENTYTDFIRKKFGVRPGITGYNQALKRNSATLEERYRNDVYYAEHVSFLLPTYNRAQTIRMAVDSVLNQTYRDIELIIVDDASTDGTQDVVTQIADDRIRYLRLEQRSGACNARNIGALSARGEFISFQDSDDKWHLDKLEKQYQFMIDRNLDFSFCGMTRIMLEDPNRKYYYPNVDMDDNKDYFDQLLYLNRVGTQTIICKRECFEKIRFDVTLKRFQDWDFALQAARIYSIGYLRESLVDSFVQKDSISKSSLANKNAWESLYNKYKKDIQKNPTTYAKYLFRLGNEVVLFNQKVAMEYYRNSFYIKKSKEALVFFVLSSLRMKSTISKLLDYQKNHLFR